MAKVLLKKKGPEMKKIEWIERAVEDLLLLVMFLFTGLISIGILGLLLFGQTTYMARLAFVADTLKEHVVPWVIALALIVISREIWLIRIYLENIHVGMELEKLMVEVSKIEKIAKLEEKEIKEIERLEKARTRRR